MTKIATVFKDAIAKAARREIRARVDPLRKASVRYRSEIAALKRDVAVLVQQLKALQRTKHHPVPGKVPDGPVRHRFSPQRLAAHRQKLGLSAQSYGRLAGVSALSIYKWETGKARPRAPQLAALASVRSLGKREAQRRLEAAA